MSPIVYVASLAAAAMNAASSIMQRQASGQPEAHELFTRKFASAVSRHPLFILGFVLQTLAAGLQALALNYGPLVVVQPLLTADLIFLLVFLRLRGVIIGGVSVWFAGLAVSAGLAGFLIIARPLGGHAKFDGAAWISLGAVMAIVAIGCIIYARRSSSIRRRTAVAAFATACLFALNAGLFKLILNQLHTGGIGHIFTSWPLYALTASGLTSVFMMQSAYGAGPLTISQPVLEVFEPAISIVIGIVIFGEAVHHTPLALFGEAICGIILMLGIVKLGTSHELAASFDEQLTDRSARHQYNQRQGEHV